MTNGFAWWPFEPSIHVACPLSAKQSMCGHLEKDSRPLLCSLLLSQRQNHRPEGDDNEPKQRVVDTVK